MSYKVKHATSEHIEEMLNIQTEAFLKREPMTMALGISEESYRKSMRWMFDHGLKLGIILVAVEDGTDKVIGLAAAYPSNFLNVVEVPEELIKGDEAAYAASAGLFEVIDRKLEARPGYKEGEYLHIYYAATHKDYGRSGIATELLEAVLANGKEQGYAYAYGETTNPKSLSAMLSNNAEILDRIEYAKCGIKTFADVKGELVLVLNKF